MLNITSGRVARPQKVVLYGVEGIGKTSLAAQCPEPLFIDTEGGTAHLDVRRLQKPESWEELISLIKEVAATPDVCRTLVIDTADWAEAMAIDHICQKYKQNSIESFGYGKGYTYLAEEFGRLFTEFDAVIESGKNVVITAHAKMRKFEQPDEQGAYDRWEMKLSKQVAPLLKEWCDMLLFLNYKTYVVTSETNSKKAQGGKRVMYTSHHPCWDAKNRHGLPAEMEMDFAGIAHLFKKPVRPVSNPDDAQKKAVAQLRTLITESGISEKDLQKVVATKGHYSAHTPIDNYSEKFITGWCLKYFGQIINMVTEDN